MNPNTTPDELARMAIQRLRLETPPSEEEIQQVVTRLAVAFDVSPENVDRALKLLHSRFEIRMERGQTIKDRHVPWLSGRLAQIDPFFWTRYQEYLHRDGWSPVVTGTLGWSMDELLDLLGNPADEDPWKRRGLVVGDVQSGKTASYAALLCKAADAGYKMVILLTGTLENVRRQTQGRLDAAFVGLDSRDFLTKGQLKHKTHIGVGKIDPRRDGIVFTSRVSDFRKTTATNLNIALESIKEPVLVVAKKNRTILDSLATWLRAKNADRQGHIDLPLLLIDDEADNASINTCNSPNLTTAINAAIRDLLALFRRSSYVGFTATPFANIFVDPESANEMLGDDLFPRDFIHLLNPPTNYVGMNYLFSQLNTDDQEEGEDPSRIVGLRTIDDSDDWLPVGHKKDAALGPLPPLPASLCDALRHFLLACAVRDLRVQSSAHGHERGIHRSMLVNVSRFTAIQNQVATDIELALEKIKAQVRLYGGLPPGQAQSALEIAELKRLFEKEFDQHEFAWPTVLAVLHESISPIRVQRVNQETGANSLDFSQADSPPGLRVIAVGGNSLSRGLTLEGLCVSYFLRNSKAYDTLLQMGRWFGYRDGYRDLCRIFLTEDAEGWYRHITLATQELKRDFARMRRQKATPEEFGLRVRTDPDTLLITARNKMATGRDVVDELRDISLTGRGIETARLYSDRLRNEENFGLIDRFLTEVSSATHSPSPHGGAEVWRNVPAEQVAKLLDDFLVHPLNHDFQGDAIATFLRESEERGDPSLSKWTVAVLTTGKKGPIAPELTCGLAADAKKRRVLVRPMQSLLISGKKARVGSREDVRHGLSVGQVEEIVVRQREENPGVTDIPEDEYRTKLESPLLLIYFIRGVERAEKNSPESDYRSGLVLPALALHFPGTKDPNAPKRYLKYRLNKIAQAEIEIDGDDLGDAPDED